MILAAVFSALALILPAHTPGARNPAVRQSTLGTTVCDSGYSSRIRPPASYTSKLKVRQLREWNYADQDPRAYQEDHFLSLSIGGSPRSTRNLWPEPWAQARLADRMEWKWHRDLCSGKLTLRQAQKAETTWKRTHG